MSIAVAGGPRLIGDDRPLGAEEGVDERGLAGVGAPDHGDPDRIVVPTLGRPVAEQLDDPVEQVAGAEPVAGGDCEWLAEAE